MRVVFIALLSASLLSWGCGKRSKIQDVNIASMGIASEVLVVANTSDKSDIESFVKKHLERKSPILVQPPENLYSFYFHDASKWEGDEKYQALMVIFDLDNKTLDKLDFPENLTPKKTKGIEVYQNVWAKPQTVIVVKEISDAVHLANALMENLFQQEIAMGPIGAFAPTKYSDSVQLLIAKNYGIKMPVPPQYRLVFSNQELIWLMHETHRFYSHVLIEFKKGKYVPKNLDSAISDRNALTRKYLKNDEGTKAVVSMSKLYPKYYDAPVSWLPSAKSYLTGWYTEEGTFRRGPFSRFYFYDEKGDRTVVFDGFLFHPDGSKQSGLRMFDIMARNMTFVQ